MKLIGITGGTGAGKTTALRVWEQMGCRVIDADAVYHTLLESGGAMGDALLARFGDILTEGKIDRKKLGAIVFRDPDALRDVNAITHRYVGREIDRQLAEAASLGCPAAAVDAIALFESGRAAGCDVTVGVLAPPEARIRRVMAREGVGEEYARMRVKAQKPDSFFEERCDYILRNDAGEAEFSAAAAALFETILGKDPKGEENMEKEKTAGELRREQLLYTPKNGYDRLTPAEAEELAGYCEGYKRFLDKGKTEREAAAEAVRLAEANGFRPLERGETPRPGERVYRLNRGRALYLAVIGAKPAAEGMHIGAAHIDAPRLDLKQNPLYEEGELAYFKTHYYGGIRKYQWVAIPLELRGAVAMRDGSVKSVVVDDPVLTITDLLPHLAADQAKKPLGEAITGEGLNLLIGSRPFPDDKGSDRVKLAVMELLHERYGIVEEDFLSAEISAVPAFPAMDAGLDRSLISAYGQDDRVCSYAALRALFDVTAPEKTAVCLLADKEEIGSEGVTGMKSAAFDAFAADLCGGSADALRGCFSSSLCLSADVTAAFDPGFADVYEKRNSARINYGVSLCKYTGARGKSGASDASAELVAEMRRRFDEDGVIWQMSELGKVDQGGGGTVAAYLAQRNIDVIDAGVPVLSMHAPYETVSKLDCYMTYRAMRALYR